MNIERLSSFGALSAIVKRSGRPMTELSKEMDRFPSYLSVFMSRRSVPGANTLAMVGKVCGYNLALVPDYLRLPDGSIVIDPQDQQD